MRPEKQAEQAIPSPSFRVWLCGTFRIERLVGDRFEPVRPAEWGGSRAPRLLLKALLCRPARQAQRDALLDLLWPDAELEYAIQNLNIATPKLRKVLEPTAGHKSVFTTEEEAKYYQLAGQSQLWVDGDAALALLREAERLGHTSAHALPLLEEATSYLGKGPFLQEEEGAWAQARRATMEQARYRCQIWLAEAYEQQEMPGQAAATLELLLEEDPTDEDVIRCLMLLLQRQGMTHQALRLYEESCKVLAQEKLELSEEIKSLATYLRRKRIPEPHFVMATSHTTTSPVLLQGSVPLPLLSALENPTNDRVLPQISEMTVSFNTSSLPAESALLTSPPHLPPTPLLEHLSKSCSPEMLSQFGLLTETCRQLSEGNELKIAEGLLWTYLPKVAYLARIASEHQHQAAAIASQGYLLAASLVGHHNRLLDRLHFSELALQYGKLAEDLNLQVVAWRQIAISYDCLRCPDKVLETYQQTYSHLEAVSPLLRACVYADVSGAHAQLGHKQEASRFIGMAYDHFPGQPEQEPAYLQTICRYSSLLFWNGLNHLLLNQPHEAERVFEEIDGLHPKIQNPERNRAEVLNYQVETFLALGKRDHACIYLEAAVKAALAVGSVRRLQETSALFQRMRHVWHSEQRVQQLAELFMR